MKIVTGIDSLMCFDEMMKGREQKGDRPWRLGIS